MKMSKVMVSGCFDALHPGHIAFLESAAQYGDLTVCIGNDQNVFELKSRATYFTQDERAYMLNALQCVSDVRISKGFGKLDFIEELQEIQPDYFVVNHDGHSEEKQEFVERSGVQYIVLERMPKSGMPARSTTQFRQDVEMPFRIDLAGGWLDQPFVNNLVAGPVITISIHPTAHFNHRSGMASSTRNSAMDLWGRCLPNDDKERLAKFLFAVDNPPGKTNVSGSQDAIGIVYPGLNKLDYEKEYWPANISSIAQEDILHWLESHLFLLPIGPRSEGFEVLDEVNLDPLQVKELAAAANTLWNSILEKDLSMLGQSMTASFIAQCKLFPLMTSNEAESVLLPFKEKILGYKISGAGGGGYWIVVSEVKMDSFMEIKIRRG
ncbi:MAG: hypothetical protein RLY35_214 [Bacteroidota bacterium]|jgi:cytidyltransferase-like protein